MFGIKFNMNVNDSTFFWETRSLLLPTHHHSFKRFEHSLATMNFRTMYCNTSFILDRNIEKYFLAHLPLALPWRNELRDHYNREKVSLVGPEAEGLLL